MTAAAASVSGLGRRLRNAKVIRTARSDTATTPTISAEAVSECMSRYQAGCLIPPNSTLVAPA
jgi:hypothetical protein